MCVSVERNGDDGFFFFQAEDGIRDKLVTGVQTCALPISGESRSEGRTAPRRPVGDGRALRSAARLVAGRTGSKALPGSHGMEYPGRPTVCRLSKEVGRSEERRVGKEWSWRRWQRQ